MLEVATFNSCDILDVAQLTQVSPNSSDWFGTNSTVSTAWISKMGMDDSFERGFLVSGLNILLSGKIEHEKRNPSSYFIVLFGVHSVFIR